MLVGQGFYGVENVSLIIAVVVVINNLIVNLVETIHYMEW